MLDLAFSVYWQVASVEFKAGYPFLTRMAGTKYECSEMSYYR